MLAAGVAAAPSFILPVLSQGERLVPFTDVPDSFQVNPVQPNTTHWQDTREIAEFVSDNIMGNQILRKILGAFMLLEWLKMS